MPVTQCCSKLHSDPATKALFALLRVTKTVTEKVSQSGKIRRKKKAHKHKLLGPVALGTTPGMSQEQTGFVPGTNSLCPKDKPRFFSLFYTM